MKIKDHLKLSCLLSIPASIVTDPIAGIAGSFLGGVLIDIDHLFDYFANYQITLDKNGLMNSDIVRSILLQGIPLKEKKRRPAKRRPEAPNKSYLIFHSIELWVGILALSLMAGSPILLVASVSALIHILSDILVWRLPWQSFFFVFRFLKGFNHEEIQEFKKRLKAVGVDVSVCVDCGRHGEEVHYEPIGQYHMWGSIKNFMVLCPECHDKRHAEAKASMSKS